MLRILKATADGRGRWLIIPLQSGCGQGMLYTVALSWHKRRSERHYKISLCRLFSLPLSPPTCPTDLDFVFVTLLLPHPLQQGLCVFMPPNSFIRRSKCKGLVGCQETNFIFLDFCENSVKWNNDCRSNERIVFYKNEICV